jgi:hypothetical protein
MLHEGGIILFVGVTMGAIYGVEMLYTFHRINSEGLGV